MLDRPTVSACIRQFPGGVGDFAGVVDVLGQLLSLDELGVFVAEIRVCTLDDVDHPMPLRLPGGLVFADAVAGCVEQLGVQLRRFVDVGYQNIADRFTGGHVLQCLLQRFLSGNEDAELELLGGFGPVGQLHAGHLLKRLAVRKQDGRLESDDLYVRLGGDCPGGQAQAQQKSKLKSHLTLPFALTEWASGGR